MRLRFFEHVRCDALLQHADRLREGDDVLNVRIARAALFVEPVAEILPAEDLRAGEPMAPGHAHHRGEREQFAIACGIESEWRGPGGVGRMSIAASGHAIREVDLRALVLLPDRAELYARCDRRFAAMLDHGAIAEVEALLARRLDPALPVMRAIGVREIAAWLRGEIDRAAMLAAASQATRNYAKRQYTWLRHQLPAGWPRLATSNYEIELIFASLFQD